MIRREKSKKMKEEEREWEFRLGLGGMVNVTCNTHLNVGFLRCASSRTTSSTDPPFTLTLMVSLKRSSTLLSWLFMVYLTVILDAEVGTRLGWLGRVGCTSWPGKSKEAKFVKDYGVCSIGTKSLLLAAYPRTHFKRWQWFCVLCGLFWRTGVTYEALISILENWS